MKKFITAVVLSATLSTQLTAETTGCWEGTTSQSPKANAIGWSPLVPVTTETSGGAIAFVQVATSAHVIALVETRGSINGKPFNETSTNTFAAGTGLNQWAGSITLPRQLLSGSPGNWAQVRCWLYEPGATVAYANASATISGK